LQLSLTGGCLLAMKKLNLKRYFDRVVLVNLKRRTDRLIQVRAALQQCDWPFRNPQVFAAIDGRVVPPPKKYADGASAWGCLCSHRQLLKQAIDDGINRLLVLEDDVCFIDGFRERVEQFLHEVPDDWDQLMLGGTHINLNGKPTLVKPGVYRVTDCERTHCYAVRGKYMHKLYERWMGGGKYNALVHCDYIMGRDPELQAAHKVYAPEYFLVGQERGLSDNFRLVAPRQFWNPPGPDLMVINLHGSQPLAAALREHGWYTGNRRNRKTDIEVKLLEIFNETTKNSNERRDRLEQWIKGMQWQLAFEPDLICTVWHPEATPELVKSASYWPVYEVTANTVKEALKQIPRKLRRPCLTVYA